MVLRRQRKADAVLHVRMTREQKKLLYEIAEEEAISVADLVRWSLYEGTSGKFPMGADPRSVGEKVLQGGLGSRTSKPVQTAVTRPAAPGATSGTGNALRALAPGVEPSQQSAPNPYAKPAHHPNCDCVVCLAKKAKK